MSFIYIKSWKYCFLKNLRNLEEKNFDPQNSEEPKNGFLTFSKPGEVKRWGIGNPTGVPGMPAMVRQQYFFNHLASINNTSSNYDWPLCCTRSLIWRIHFWNWWSHGVTQCESLTPINIQWELWPFSKFVTWPWGQLYIYFFTICSRRYIFEMQNFFWIVICIYFMMKIFWNYIPTWNSYLDFQLLWQDFANYWPPKLTFSTSTKSQHFWTTYPPVLVKVVFESPPNCPRSIITLFRRKILLICYYNLNKEYETFMMMKHYSVQQRETKYCSKISRTF